MNKYKFLKSINDNKSHHVDDPKLDNSFNQFLLELEKQGLIECPQVYLSDGNPGLVAYWITAKGIDYIDTHSPRQKIFNIMIGALFGALFSFIVWLIENYLFKK